MTRWQVTELRKITPAMQWNSYFEGIGAKDLDTIIVSQPKYMKALQDLLAENSVEEWKTYLKWDLFNDAASALSTDLEKESWEFYSKTLRGAKEQRPRNERALSTINGVVGEALGKLYVEKHFPPQAKETAKEMVDNILKAYETRINKSFMDE